MALVEHIIGQLLGGENDKCAFVRSSEFLKLRLSALYKGPVGAMIVVYSDTVKITLDNENWARIFLLEEAVAPEGVLGKRRVDDIHHALTTIPQQEASRKKRTFVTKIQETV